jgi:general secretion pathway protein D
VRPTRRLQTLLLPVALLAGVGALRAQTPGARSTPQGIVIDFQDADVRAVITALAEAAGLNVIFGDLPQRRVTLRLRQPVPADSVPGLLRTIAEANALRVIEQGGLMRFEAPPAAAPVSAAALRAQGEPQLYVYRLRHANAVRLAATLQSVFGGVATAAPASVRPALSQRLREQVIPPVRLDSAPRPPRGAEQAGAATPIAAQLQGDVQIVPDETTNSLLVRAAPGDWSVIQQAVLAVDLRPLQVLIEVLIAEVRRDRDYEVGLSGGGSRRRAGGSDSRGRVGGDTGAADFGELVLRWMNGGRVNVDVALRLLARRGTVRILSRPVLLAQNNQEARILVGSQQPFIQSSLSMPTDVIQRDIVQYRDVGTSLTILPTVNPDGYVNLQLTQEVSAATNETRFGAPVISTREASTTLFVRDSQTTVIGGLIDRQGEKVRSGIPVLMSIPLLGGLFGGTRDNTTVSELFLFLTPHIVRSDEDRDRVRDDVRRRLELLDGELPKNPPVGPASPPPAPERRP